MKKLHFLTAALWVLALLWVVSPAPAQANSLFSWAEQTLSITVPVAGNVYGAAYDVLVSNPIAGDLFAAGNSIRVSSTIDGDVMGAAGNIYVDTAVAGDVRVAWQNIVVNQNVWWDLIAFGSSISIASGVTIWWDLVVYWAMVQMNGLVNGNANIGAASVALDGQIKGNAKLEMEEIALGGNAKIDGALNYKAPKQHADLENIVAWWSTYKISVDKDFDSQKMENVFLKFIGWIVLYKRAFLTLFALVLAFVFKKFFVGVSDTLRKKPRKSFFTWALIYFVTPVAILVLLITILGAPIAWIVALLYAALWIMSWFVSVAIISSWIVDTFRGGLKEAEWWKILLVVVVVAFLFAIISGFDFIAVLFAIWALTLYKAKLAEDILDSLE